MPYPLGDELTELHVHLGGAVDPAAMWGIAHDQGIRLPTKDYWEFVDLITVRKQSKISSRCITGPSSCSRALSRSSSPCITSSGAHTARRTSRRSSSGTTR